MVPFGGLAYDQGLHFSATHSFPNLLFSFDGRSGTGLRKRGGTKPLTDWGFASLKFDGLPGQLSRSRL